MSISLVESSGGNQLARSPAGDPTCETAGHAKTRTTYAAKRVLRTFHETRTPWVQHTLARDAPSIHLLALFSMYFTLHGNSVQNLPRRTLGATNPCLPAPHNSFFNHHPWTSVQVGLQQYPDVATQNTGCTTPRLLVPRVSNHLLP